MIHNFNQKSTLYDSFVVKLKFILSGNCFQENDGYGGVPIFGYNSMRNEWNDVILPAVPSEQFTHRMSYNIRGLDTASEYEAKVMAKNRFGWTPMSDVFKFVTSAKPENGKIQVLTVLSNS